MTVVMMIDFHLFYFFFVFFILSVFGIFFSVFGPRVGRWEKAFKEFSLIGFKLYEFMRKGS